MPFDMQTSDSGSTLTLYGRLSVQQARPLWDAAQAAGLEERPLVVHAGELQDLDTSIVQILCRIARQGGRFQISGSSDGFLLALARRGLDRFFLRVHDDAPWADRELKPVAGQPTAEDAAPRKIARKKAQSSKGRKSRG